MSPSYNSNIFQKENIGNRYHMCTGNASWYKNTSDF